MKVLLPHSDRVTGNQDVHQMLSPSPSSASMQLKPKTTSDAAAEVPPTERRTIEAEKNSRRESLQNISAAAG